MEREYKILISGGGTGGHIFPAIAIANEIKRRHPGAKILFVGAEGRMEMERVPAAGYEIVGLPVCGFDRKNLLRNVVVLVKLFKSMHRAKAILRDFQPDVAIGVGGYASGPMLKAAQKRHIPTLIQEQNSYAGVTNKLLAARADVICVAYEGMDRFFPADKIVLTGNPVRRNLVECQLSHAEAVKKMGLDPSRKTILVVGGSLGARTLNESVAKGIDLIKEHKNEVQVVLQTGKYYDEEMRNFLVCMDAGNVLQMPFILFPYRLYPGRTVRPDIFRLFQCGIKPRTQYGRIRLCSLRPFAGHKEGDHVSCNQCRYGRHYRFHHILFCFKVNSVIVSGKINLQKFHISGRRTATG